LVYLKLGIKRNNILVQKQVMKIIKCVSVATLIAIPVILSIADADSFRKFQKDAAGNDITVSIITANDSAKATTQILRPNRTAEIDLNYLWVQNADFCITGLDARSYKDYSISLGDTAMHPTVVSDPELFGVDSNAEVKGYKRNMTGAAGGAGFRTIEEFKWLNWMVFTPLIKGEINENPTLRVSDKDSIDWVRPYAVITDGHGSYDTVFCREPLCDVTDFPGSRHLSDPNLSRTHDRKMLLVVRASYLGADSIMGMTSADGIEWSDPFRIYGAAMNMAISPGVVLNADNTYRLYFVNGKIKEPCISYVECGRGKPYDLASSWSPTPVVCTVQAGLSSRGIFDGTDTTRYPWHFEIQRYENQYIMGWVAGIVYRDGAYFSISTDGVNFATHPAAVMPIVKTTGGTARDLLTMYKFSFTFRETEEGLEMPVWYSAYNRRGFPYLGYATLHLGRPQQKSSAGLKP
jgi:hypothetical protein